MDVVVKKRKASGWKELIKNCISCPGQQKHDHRMWEPGIWEYFKGYAFMTFKEFLIIGIHS